MSWLPFQKLGGVSFTQKELSKLEGVESSTQMSHVIFFYPEELSKNNLIQRLTWLNVEIMSDAALILHYCKLTVTRTDVFCKILLSLQQLENIKPGTFLEKKQNWLKLLDSIIYVTY